MLNQAIVFPGQGSQSVGMLHDLASKYPMITEKFREVSDVLNFDYWNLTQQGPVETLNQTEYTQVVMLVADVAIYSVIQSLGQTTKPQMMAGHSLGEYAALVCSGALNLTDAAELVRARGRLMQETIPLGSGAMAAIVGLSDEQVEDICQQASTASELVTPANFNTIGQVVIAGNTPAVERAITIAENMQARMATIIPVSVPCHCPLLHTAAEKFAEVLANTNISIPEVPVVSNVDLSIYKSVEQIKELLAKQLYSPVQWVKTIQLMQKEGVQQILECGPGKVLSGLAKRIDRSLQVDQVSRQLLA